MACDTDANLREAGEDDLKVKANLEFTFTFARYFTIVQGEHQAASSVSSAIWTWLSEPSRHKFSGNSPTMNDARNVPYSRTRESIARIVSRRQHV
jgi:hypothetical protein